MRLPSFRSIATRGILAYLLGLGAIRSLNATLHTHIVSQSSPSSFPGGALWNVLLLRGGEGEVLGGASSPTATATTNIARPETGGKDPPTSSTPTTSSPVAVPEEEEEDELSAEEPEQPPPNASSLAAAIPESSNESDVEFEAEERVAGQQQTAAASAGLGTRTRNNLAARRLEFLDRIALISSSLLQRERPREDEILPELEGGGDATAVTPQSDLTLPGRNFYIVTTASLPWFTGTAVNPLLRAAMLHRRTQQINGNDKTVSNDDDADADSTAQTKEDQEKQERRWVTLVVPWLELPEDQQELYGKVFESEQEQEAYIRSWLRDSAGLADAARPDTGLRLLFYPARYHRGLRSVFAMGDPMNLMDPAKLDVCILEEPEHINWYRAPGDGWKKRFNYVVGVIHTNYKEYVSSQYHGLWTAPTITLMSSAMVRAYCHTVIRLSSVLQSYAPEKEETSNVHGVRDEFLEEGLRRAEVGWKDQADAINNDKNSVQAYFIGKLLWGKGLDIMLDLEDYYKTTTGEYFGIDIYGDGPDKKDIVRAYHGRRDKMKTAASPSNKRSNQELNGLLGGSAGKNETTNGSVDSPVDDDVEELPLSSSSSLSRWKLRHKAKKKLAKFKRSIDDIDMPKIDLPKTFYELRRTPIPAKFPGRVDHAALKQYKVFVNPSVSEVLCTTTAEALAMGKFAIVPAHPSNTFFYRFPNCLAYRNKFEFVANLRWALTHDPEPLSQEKAREFTWEAATDRLIEASAITWEDARRRERLGSSKLDERIAWLHYEIGKGVTGDMIRKILGAGPVADQVKYTSELELQAAVSSPYDGDDEDEDDGLSPKFRKSSFAENIRVTIADLSSFLQ